nr:T9SS type A sorting domain-containing protein [Ignavibacteriaceae bacterium]
IPGSTPSAYALEQNFPNPFNPGTTINFSIPAEGFVTLDVYNSIGQKVASLVNETKTAGSYTVGFDASDLTSGIYFYKISSGNFTETKKMILLK